MPFKQHGAVALDAVVNVRVTAVEKQQLRQEAETAGLTVSRLMRRRAFGRRVVASADAAVLRELRRMGGLLKHTHLNSGGVYSKETAQALVAVKQYIEALSRDR